MIILKYIVIFIIFLISTIIGYLISKRYSSRVQELKEMQNAINILENKIKFTYEPLPEIFLQISTLLNNNIGEIFKNASSNIKQRRANNAWEEALTNSQTNFTKEDLEILKNIGKLLGKTDKDGQVSQLELSKTFISSQIEKAENEEKKNSKMYKTLGTVVGLAIMIILV